jgi:nitrous oxidase accessory protein NosD
MRTFTRSVLVAVTAATTAIAVAAPVGAASSTIVVHPGQSIQAAVDKAHSGDTVKVEAGTYHQNVVIKKNGITLRADGRVTLRSPAAKKGFCDFPGAQHAICVIAPDVNFDKMTFTKRVRDVTVTGFRVVGFTGFGLFSFGSANLRISHVTAVNNGDYGIARFDGVGGSIRDSAATGSAEAGLYIGDSPNAHAVLSDNRAWNNGLGIFVRHNHFVTVSDNEVFGNCIGILLLDDGQKPGSGDQVVKDNSVRRNNKVCPASEDSPAFSGGGIVLAGSVRNVIADNEVSGNRGNTFASGGIVLITSPDSHKGANNNLVVRNELKNNKPADIVQDKGSKGNKFRDNDCDTSKPAGLC